MRSAALTPVEAYEAIQRLLDLGPDVISFTQHARTRSAGRNFNRRDVERVLRNALVSPSPEWNEAAQQWKYRITGSDVDGDELTLVVAIEPNLQRMTVITGGI